MDFEHVSSQHCHILHLECLRVKVVKQIASCVIDDRIVPDLLDPNHSSSRVSVKSIRPNVDVCSNRDHCNERKARLDLTEIVIPWWEPQD